MNATDNATPAPPAAASPNPAADLDLDKLEAELREIKKEYHQLRTQANQTINTGVSRSDDRHVQALRQQIGV